MNANQHWYCKFIIELTSRLSYHHVAGYDVGQHDSFVKKIRDDLGAGTAGGEGGQNDEEKGCNEGHGDGYEQQYEEPDERPQTTATRGHGVRKTVLYL